jgi:hypothetical protein
MTSKRLSNQFPKDPNTLLNAVIGKLNLKNDAALCRALDVPPPVISKIRHHRIPLGSAMLVRLLEVTELSLGELSGLTMGAETPEMGVASLISASHDSGNLRSATPGGNA